MFLDVTTITTQPTPPASFEDTFAVVEVLYGVVNGMEPNYPTSLAFMQMFLPVGGLRGYFRDLMNRPLTQTQILTAFRRLQRMGEAARVAAVNFKAEAPDQDGMDSVITMCERVTDYFFYTLKQNNDSSADKLTTRFN